MLLTQSCGLGKPMARRVETMRNCPGKPWCCPGDPVHPYPQSLRSRHSECPVLFLSRWLGVLRSSLPHAGPAGPAGRSLPSVHSGARTRLQHAGASACALQRTRDVQTSASLRSKGVSHKSGCVVPQVAPCHPWGPALRARLAHDV